MSVYSSPEPRPILFITRKWLGQGGMQQLSRDLSRELHRAYGSRVTCCHPHSKGVFGLFSFSVRSLFLAISLTLSFLTFTRRQEVPSSFIIHLGDAALLPLGIILQKITSGKLSVTACGLDVTYPAAWYQRMMRVCLPKADRIVCISRATANEVRTRGVLNDRIVIIPCGIDDKKPMHMKPADPNLLVTIGRLIPRKGIAWFIECVLPILRTKYPGVRYMAIGKGSEESHIRDIIKKTGQESVVELKTDCGDAERDDILASAAVFIAPNIPIKGDMEGFGIVCIEASSHGIPVVAARLEGLTDTVLEGQTGVFFEPLNAQDCADKIAMVFGRADHCSLVIERARAHFGWSVLFPLYQKHVFGK